MIIYYWFILIGSPKAPSRKVWGEVLCGPGHSAHPFFLLPSPCVPLSYKLPIPCGRNSYAWKGSFWHWICVQVSQVLAGPLFWQVGLAKNSIAASGWGKVFFMGSPSKKRRANKIKWAKALENQREKNARHTHGSCDPALWLVALLRLGCELRTLVAINSTFCLIFPISVLGSFTVFHGNRAFHGPLSAVIGSILCILERLWAGLGVGCVANNIFCAVCMCDILCVFVCVTFCVQQMSPWKKTRLIVPKQSPKIRLKVFRVKVLQQSNSKRNRSFVGKWLDLFDSQLKNRQNFDTWTQMRLCVVHLGIFMARVERGGVQTNAAKRMLVRF